MQEIWDRVRQGKHSLVVGELQGPPPEGPTTLVRVVCDRPGTLGPLDEVRQRVLELLGEDASSWEHTIEDVTMTALRRRVLGEVAVRGVEAELVAACNRLAALAKGSAVVVLERLDQADEATLRALHEILGEPGWLRLPLVLQFDSRPDTAPGSQLVELFEGRFSAAVTPGKAASDTAAVASGFDPSTLPDAALHVLRVAAVIGPTFEAELVARVLGLPEGTVLERLQQAADHGAPLADRGDGTFSIPASTSERLLQRVLPSLAAHWHRSIAALLVSEAPPASAEAFVPPRPEPRAESVVPLASEPPASTQTPPVEPGRYAEMYERASDLAGEGDEDVAARLGARPFSEWKQKKATQRAAKAMPTGDQARAARHLMAAGERAEAVRQYVQAVDQVAARGDTRRALLLAQEGLDLVADIQATPVGALLRARLLALVGRIRWQGAGTGPGHSLEQALHALQEAQDALPDNAPARDRAAVASLVAGVCYDLGDPRSLERALAELTSAARMLHEAGEAIDAARLLNDQAAVYLRAGDPVRASHLLTSSREVFETLRREDPKDAVIEEELAETEHLLAKLPLTARLRPGREAEAFSLAMGHARAAESAYRRLARPRALARVWETLGRLELRRTRLEEAARWLDQAGTLQRRIGDVIGLARTAAGLSDVYAGAGQPMDALALLGESISLNTQKGSPLGLAFNRKAIEVLTRALEGDGQGTSDLAAAIDELKTRLEQAESLIGKTAVPGD